MATQTSNLNLSKAEITDEILSTLQANNDNFDILDATSKELSDNIETKQNKLIAGENIIIDGDVISATSSGGSGGDGNLKVLEASPSNVIDFDDLTEPGIYLIKNCLDNLTTVNSGLTSSSTTTRFDVIMEVVTVVNSAGTPYTFQTKQAGMNVVATGSQRYLLMGTWSSWTNKTISTSLINKGTLATGMKCATPTADEELANKAYVDGKTWDASKVTAGTFAGKVVANGSAVASLNFSQVRSIRATATDLTAGTSALATGDIVLVYE